MENKYREITQQASTLAELEQIKTDFLSECDKRADKIAVSNLLENVKNFGGAKTMFESMTSELLSKKGGKELINKYVKTIKENKSLKTIYTFIEGLNSNTTSESKKAYITEALSLTTPINYNQYVKGVGDVINLVLESFKLVGDKYVIDNVSYDSKSDMISESLVYLSMTKKNIKNLNEHMNHVDKVSNLFVESKVDVINADSTLEEIVTKFNTKVNENSVDTIFNTDNKEESFKKNKQTCLEMISKQKTNTTDSDIVNRLNEMEEKLSKKEYTYETYTKDMLYMTELQEVLNS